MTKPEDLSVEAQDALIRHGYDPSIPPGQRGPDGKVDKVYDEVRYEQTVVRSRRRVCELDDIIIDGHDWRVVVDEDVELADDDEPPLDDPHFGHKCWWCGKEDAEWEVTRAATLWRQRIEAETLEVESLRRARAAHEAEVAESQRVIGAAIAEDRRLRAAGVLVDPDAPSTSPDADAYERGRAYERQLAAKGRGPAAAAAYLHLIREITDNPFVNAQWLFDFHDRADSTDAQGEGKA